MIKMQELHEMLNVSSCSESDIIEKIRNIRTFTTFHQLEVNPLDEAMFVAIAKDLQPFYERLWGFRSWQDCKSDYLNLSLITRSFYRRKEVKKDWINRRYSKDQYDQMIAYLNGVGYWLNELKDRFKQYEMAQIYYADRQEYMLNWAETIKKYEHKILKRVLHNVKEIAFNMIQCPTGEFWMGTEDEFSLENENPRHKVQITQKVWIGETQVTQALWQAVMGWNPSHFTGSMQLPVENVTWYDCLMFCNQLSELEELTPCFTLNQIQYRDHHIDFAVVTWHRNANGYRLATEAEWEYCAKAGTELMFSGSNHIDEVACYRYNTNNKTCEVKTKNANAWGLYDMSGNVWEWCMDQSDDLIYKNRKSGHVENPISWRDEHCARIMRGGSYWNPPDFCRVYVRYREKPNITFRHRGLRVLRSEPNNRKSLP
jgi:formylglycine-generating enzyme required for sulfatase activity